MKQLALLLCVVASIADAAISNTHLVPAGGIYAEPYEGEYPRALERLLRANVPFSHKDFVFVVYVLPSWGGERMLAFEDPRKDPCTRGAVVSLESSLYATLKEKTPLPAVSSEIGCVSTNLICEATEVITRALVHSRYPDPPQNGGDGVSFVYMAFVDGYGVIEGHTWSPAKGSPMFNLVALSTSLDALVRTANDPTATSKAYASIDLLRKQLPSAVKANQPLHPDAACGRAGERRR